MKLDLDRYNRVLWAFLGTLAALGLLALLIGGIVAGISELWSSGQERQGLAKVLQAPEAQADLPASILSQELPIRLEGTDILLVAVEGLNHGSEEASGGFGSYSKGDRERPVVNLLFVNSRTRDSHALLNKKAFITRHEVLADGLGTQGKGQAGSSPAKAVGLALRVIESDTNGNGRVDVEDDERVYLCDPTGKNLRAVLAPGQTCLNWQYDTDRRILYLLIRDTPHAKGHRPTELYSVSLDGSQLAQPLVSKAQMDSLRALFQR